MTPRQCEIAAESAAASQLAQTGYDVLVQYGPHQDRYDLAAVRDTRILLVNVKGSQNGGWLLATKKAGKTYREVIDEWEARLRPDLVLLFAQFKGVAVGEMPRCYVVRVSEAAELMRGQNRRQGYGVIYEHYSTARFISIPQDWRFSQERIDNV